MRSLWLANGISSARSCFIFGYGPFPGWPHRRRRGGHVGRGAG
jgi:hypothetical protein